MVYKIDFPTPLRRRLIVTTIIGVACFLIGFALFLFMKDQTTLLLSLTVLAMSIGKAISYYRILSNQSYEIVEGTCVAIAPKPLRKYRKVKIMDNDGNEISLLLDKQSKIKIGYQYKFYFKETDRITIGSEYFDSALNSDCFLGFEEVGVFTES